MVKNKKNIKKLSSKRKKILISNIIFSSIIILVMVIVGINDLFPDLFSSYNSVEINKDNYQKYLINSIQGKLEDKMGRENEYYDTIKINGNINPTLEEYNCKKVKFTLIMQIDYTKYDGSSFTEEIKEEVKLNDKCQYNFEIEEELKNIGKNPTYSYKISNLKGQILLPKDKSK